MSDSAFPTTTTMARGRHLRLMSSGGWEYVERIGATGVVAVMAVTDDAKLILTDQFRTPVQSRVIDLPAGLVGDGPADDDEPFNMAACRELEEETGYTAATFRQLAQLPSSPGLTAETIFLYKATEVRKVGDGGGVDDERIDVHVIPLSQVTSWLEQKTRQDYLVDPKVYTALWWCEHSKTDSG